MFRLPPQVWVGYNRGMKNMKEAVYVATDFLKEMYPEMTDFRLEGVETTTDDNFNSR